MIRIEQLNYKVRPPSYLATSHWLMHPQRLMAGMKVLCQVISVHALALIVSLPNQLVGHVPITQISAHYTSLLSAMADEDRDGPGSDIEDEDEEDSVPNLAEMFQPGQYVRAVVTAVKPAGTRDTMGPNYAMDEMERTSRRVELSLDPAQVHAGLTKAVLCPGLVCDFISAYVTWIDVFSLGHVWNR